jgi:hypothetical protein
VAREGFGQTLTVVVDARDDVVHEAVRRIAPARHVELGGTAVLRLDVDVRPRVDGTAVTLVSHVAGTPERLVADWGTLGPASEAHARRLLATIAAFAEQLAEETELPLAA